MIRTTCQILLGEIKKTNMSWAGYMAVMVVKKCMGDFGGNP
jgi:hypothetical protein